MSNQLNISPPRAFNRNGEPLAGAKAYIYKSGTVTPVTVEGRTGGPLPWPLVADLDGSFPQMFYGGDLALKLVITDANDVVQPGYPLDPIPINPPTYLTAATQAEAEAGGSSTAYMTPRRTAQAIAAQVPDLILAAPLALQYKSPRQEITSGAVLILPHELGAIPDLVFLRLVCEEGEEAYDPDDAIIVDVNNSSSGTSRANSVVYNATNIRIRFSDQPNCFVAANKATGVITALTNSKWSLVVYAWA